jgi:hypothetical protein
MVMIYSFLQTEPASYRKSVNRKNVLQLRISPQKVIKPMLLNYARPLSKDDAHILSVPLNVRLLESNNKNIYLHARDAETKYSSGPCS